MWKEAFDVYVDDKHKMGMAEFFDKNSPFAYQDITARMLETVRKGYWKADAATERRLLEEYVASVTQHGVGCAEHTCGNPRLQQYVMQRGLRAGIPVPDLEGFKREMEKATGEAIDLAAEREEAFSRQNDAQMAARLAAVPVPSRMSRELEGYSDGGTGSFNPGPQRGSTGRAPERVRPGSCRSARARDAPRLEMEEAGDALVMQNAEFRMQNAAGRRRTLCGIAFCILSSALVASCEHGSHADSSQPEYDRGVRSRARDRRGRLCRCLVRHA